jgi:hypothetical protein
MLFFDWNKILKLSRGNTKNIIRLLAIYVLGLQMPKNRKDLHRLYNQDISGNSFLINPRPIIKNVAQASFEDIVMYVELASLRNYLDFKWQGFRRLPLRYTEIDRETIENNPLLEIDGQDNITFYYEEEKNGN